VMLCGSGTTGCHGLIEHHDAKTRRVLASYIRKHRPDTFAYLNSRFQWEGANDWLRRILGA
jgi:hypothetical protein